MTTNLWRWADSHEATIKRVVGVVRLPADAGGGQALVIEYAVPFKPSYQEPDKSLEFTEKIDGQVTLLIPLEPTGAPVAPFIIQQPKAGNDWHMTKAQRTRIIEFANECTDGPPPPVPAGAIMTPNGQRQPFYLYERRLVVLAYGFDDRGHVITFSGSPSQVRAKIAEHPGSFPYVISVPSFCRRRTRSAPTAYAIAFTPMTVVVDAVTVTVTYPAVYLLNFLYFFHPFSRSSPARTQPAPATSYASRPHP